MKLLSAKLLLVLAMQVSAAEINLVESEGGTFILEGTDVMLDTGSKYTVVNSLTKNDSYLRTVSAVLADGRIKQYPVYNISKYYVLVCSFENIEAVFVKNGKNILGLNIIKQMSPVSLYTIPTPKLFVNCE